MTPRDRPRHGPRRSSVPSHELRIFLLVGGAGLVVLPFLVYFAGAATLGPYAGGLGAFLTTLYGDLVRFAPGAWGLLLGPYVLFQVLRLLTRPWRHRNRTATAEPAA
jgi:hypothetical protein